MPSHHNKGEPLLMMTIQKYIRPASLEEAYTLNQVKANRLVGGMVWMKMSNRAVNTAIDLSGLGLDTIEENDREFRIGAMVTLRQLEQHPGFNAYTRGAAAASVQDIVGVQFRNLATVGGSIFSRFGFSDLLTFFLSLDCRVELYKAGTVSLEEFAKTQPDRDILVRLVVKKIPGRFSYSAMRIARTDFPVLTCAVSRVGDEYRAVIGARPGRAMVVRDEEGLLAGGITPESAAAFGKYAARVVPTGSNSRGSAAYRTRLVSTLTRRGLEQLGRMK